MQAKCQRRRVELLLARFGGEADVPRLVGDATACADRFGVRQEETEIPHMVGEPLAQVGKPAPGFILPGLQRQFGVGGQAVRVIDVEIGAPVVATGAGQGAPAQNGVQPLLVTQLQGVDGLAVGIEQRPLAAPLAIPDGELAIKTAPAGRRLQVETGVGGRHLHVVEGGRRSRGQAVGAAPHQNKVALVEPHQLFLRHASSRSSTPWYMSASRSRSSAFTHSFTLWMVALTGPSSITSAPVGAIKRPSEVPPVVSRAGR